MCTNDAADVLNALHIPKGRKLHDPLVVRLEYGPWIYHDRQN
jgi:hypothetical protein